jgi:hypothetical protein
MTYDTYLQGGEVHAVAFLYDLYDLRGGYRGLCGLCACCLCLRGGLRLRGCLTTQNICLNPLPLAHKLNQRRPTLMCVRIRIMGIMRIGGSGSRSACGCGRSGRSWCGC